MEDQEILVALGRQRDYSFLLNIQSGSASNPQSSSINGGNPCPGGKAAEVWRFSLPLSAEILNGWMTIYLYSPIRFHETQKSHATLLLLLHDNVDHMALVSLGISLARHVTVTA